MPSAEMGEDRLVWSQAGGSRWLTLQQVSQELGVSVETLRRWIKRGRLKARMLGGSKLGYRVRTTDLEAFVNQHRQTTGHE